VSTLPLLVVEHEAQCPPGWMGEWLAEAGLELDVRRPYATDELPPDLTGHSGMLVLGGSMGAYDDEEHPWLRDVKRLVSDSAVDGPPVLGICLGLQLAAVALGGEVAPVPRGQQIGVLDVAWTEEARHDAVFARLAALDETPGVQWNNDLVVHLPAAAVDLAHTPHGELQAARLAPSVWGVQWHPEAGDEIIRPWADSDRDDAVERGVDVDAYVDDVTAARDRLRTTWKVLAETFASVCREPALAEVGRR
jgi:GMP synthase (glutamine-hydrolysing)